ncbi:MAG: glycosyltransferase [Alphaproteobacteria bacterium]|nr:glycosyltransferase [Alphaproteobacteria bacterium]
MPNGNRRRVLIHDFGGFAFPAQLGRELARRGHEVRVLYADLDIRGGRLQTEFRDPAGFAIRPVTTGHEFRKNEIFRRAYQEYAYARLLTDEVAAFAPDYVFNTNAPMIVSWVLRRRAAAADCAYVHWTQDIHTHTIGYVLERRLGPVGRLGRRLVRWVERDVITKAASVIVIAGDFESQLARLGICSRSIHVIPNWMPADEIMPRPKDNEFSRAFGLAGTFNVMYTGMLGHKHEIAPLLALAEACEDLEDFRLVVVGRGFGFERLRQMEGEKAFRNLVLVEWQGHERFSNVLASADILLAVITPDASPSSVPSKILAYLCAGRAVLAAVPEDNLGRRLVEEAGLGIGVHPRDSAKIISLVRHLYEEPTRLVEYGARARCYAETAFEIGPIADRFETVMADIIYRQRVVPDR